MSLATYQGEEQRGRGREIRPVTSTIPALDTAHFEHMYRIARVMASSSLIPKCLRDEQGDYNVTLGNCFLIVNQAVRWGMDPFAVAQCVSIVHGKLVYEGKLVAAVIEAKLGIRLRYEWDGRGDDLRIVVSGKREGDDSPLTIEGTVGRWKTFEKDRKTVNWNWLNNARMMLAYRGAREWCRLHAPALMLGVYTPDEMDDLSEAARADRARDVTSEARATTSQPRQAAKALAPPDPDDEEMPPSTPAGRDKELVEAGGNVSRETTAKAVPPEPDADGPSPWAALYERSPEDFRASLLAAFAAAGTKQALDDIWNDRIDLGLEGVEPFPGDQQDWTEAYEHHVRRLGASEELGDSWPDDDGGPS